MVTQQSVLTSTRTSSPSSEVVTMRQTDGAAHKLKPRSFHKSAHLRVHPADFHPSVNCTWHLSTSLSTPLESPLYLLTPYLLLYTLLSPSYSYLHTSLSLIAILSMLLLLSHVYLSFFSQTLLLSHAPFFLNIKAYPWFSPIVDFEWWWLHHCIHFIIKCKFYCC